MFIRPYDPHEIEFAYCYRIYLRFRTHYNHSYPALLSLVKPELESLLLPYNLHLLELATDSSNVLATLSLKPGEPISACADKVKGRVSKWLRTALGIENATNLLSKGYFACTVGANTREAVERYLDSQPHHHGYDQRLLPPVFVQTFDVRPEVMTRITPKHAVVVAQFHVVLSTLRRHGVFGQEQGRRISRAWRELSESMPFVLTKVSFVPDHVHLALRLHPALSPADVVIGLMNSAQPLMEREMIATGIERLWQPSAYLGSYGELANAQIRSYLLKWAEGVN